MSQNIMLGAACASWILGVAILSPWLGVLGFVFYALFLYSREQGKKIRSSKK